MKKNFITTRDVLKVALPLIFCFSTLCYAQNVKQYTLWYKNPASDWEKEALPVGNGRIGAMVFGGIDEDIYQFNEESLWSGLRYNPNNPNALNHLDEIRQLLFENKNIEAFDLAEKNLVSFPKRLRSYQTFGNLRIKFDIDKKDTTQYERCLNLNSGIARTSFVINGIKHQREIFASASDNLIFIKLSTEKAKNINAELTLERIRDANVNAKGNSLIMKGQIIGEPSELKGPGGEYMKFASIAKIVHTDGDLTAKQGKLIISNAGEVVLALTAFTDYNIDSLNFDKSIDPLALCTEALVSIRGKTYNDLKQQHIDIFQPVFERMDIDLNGDNEKEKIPTDKRLLDYKNGETDSGLIELYFQYGRYLLMSSSGFFAKLPANLQGIWNKDISAPWQSDYHTNINIQMNYWPAEVCNLSECVLPYARFFNRVRETGRVTARETYKSRGWVLHHVSNPFGYTGIQFSVKYGMFPMGAAWVCFPVWRHFEYTADTAYLKNIAWPMIKEADEFIIDFLVESPEGFLVTSPSYSPENSFYLPDSKEETQLTYAPTMDIMIIREIFKYSLQAIETLQTDTGMADTLNAILKKLPPIRIGNDGTIMEWIKDYEEREPGHRHISHLIGLHPGTQITPDDKKLFAAAQKTIEKRLDSGGGHTGWSRAWIINFYARLLMGNEAYKHIKLLLQKSTYNNLFDTHPPFQIDGNFGGTAGIAEMLLHSHNNEIKILPALPDVWDKGKISGIMARGGFELTFNWKSGKLDQLTVTSKLGNRCKLNYNGEIYEFATQKGKTYRFDQFKINK